MVINAEDPERVYIESWNTGLLIGDNPIIGWSMADYYMQNGNPADAVAANGFFGKLENGVITFGEKLLCQQVDMGDGQGYGMYYADIDGTFRVVLLATKSPSNGKLLVCVNSPTVSMANISSAIPSSPLPTRFSLNSTCRKQASTVS